MAWAWAYLGVSLVGAAFVVNAYLPARYGPTSVGSFFAGWFTGELPLHHIVWQLAATIAFGVLGAFGSWPGWVGLAVTAVSWTGLIGLFRAGRRARLVLTDALAELDTVDAEVPPGADGEVTGEVDRIGAPRSGAGSDAEPDAFDPATMWRAWRLAFPVPRVGRSIEIIRNLDYDGDGDGRHRLDVYRRRDPRPVAAPVLVYIHGGAWIIGNKRQQGLPMLFELARRGWVCVTINYRLSPRATWPAHIVDCNKAVAWVRAHIAEYGGDPGFIAVSGGSAGGHLCSLLALTDDAAYKPGFEDADTSVDACVPFYGVYDMTAGIGVGQRRRFGSYDDGLMRLLEESVFKAKLEEDRKAFEDASPLYRVHAGAPPFFALHGTNDTLVPVSEARRFVSALRAVSGEPVLYAELPVTQHAFDVLPSVRSAVALEAVVQFLERMRVRKTTRRAAAGGAAASAAVPSPGPPAGSARPA